ncbi:hypothetical protein BCV70DRAFT_202632 [Testicularia cyperi]|uniref:Pre-rRNA-processing protein TSR2 n=1 Tax=Testicularia cyperi TaxID=1882483 RepID=A0A317XIN3_9BASI|nr:hypothetical protein BCV70DRAFT_202632 [Testicularia cyperi]
MSASAQPCTSAAALESDQPTPQQLLFAKAVILTFELWPAMRLAVSEEWGGPDSADKRDFLISHLCDEYGQAGPAFEPDLDDLADVLEGYIVDEFECRLEDGSPDWVAGRIVGLHRTIFDSTDLAKAQEVVQELDKAAQELRGKNSNVSRGPEQDNNVDGEMEHDDAHHDPAEAAARHMANQHGGITSADNLGAQIGLEQQERRQQPEQPPVRQEPIIDEDGFETVVGRRRRK